MLRCCDDSLYQCLPNVNADYEHNGSNAVQIHPFSSTRHPTGMQTFSQSVSSLQKKQSQTSQSHPKLAWANQDPDAFALGDDIDQIRRQGFYRSNRCNPAESDHRGECKLSIRRPHCWYLSIASTQIDGRLYRRLMFVQQIHHGFGSVFHHVPLEQPYILLTSDVCSRQCDRDNRQINALVVMDMVGPSGQYLRRA